MNQTFSITVDVPQGYEATGEYRPAIGEEIYLDRDSEGGIEAGPSRAGSHFILRRAWMPPTWLPIDNWLYWNGSEWKITNRPPRPRAGAPNLLIATTGAATMSVATLAVFYGHTWVAPPNTSTLSYQL